MRLDEIVTRITGLTCPVFGVTWQPPEAHTTVARRVLTYLEDRRVLYAPRDMEVPWQCFESAMQIRAFLTNELQGLSPSDLTTCLRTMRAACREFVNGFAGPHGASWAHRSHPFGHELSWEFACALGAFRASIGVQVARLAAMYGLDVEDELASCMPIPSPDGDDEGE